MKKFGFYSFENDYIIETTKPKMVNLTEQISYYFLIILLPIGVFFNFVSLYLFSRPKMNKTYMGYLFAILSIWNNVQLIYELLIIKAPLVFLYSLNTCGLLTYFKQNIFNISSWLHVIISIERFICVSQPKRIPTKKLLNLIMGIFILFIVVTNTTYLFFYQVNEFNTTNFTVKFCASSKQVVITSETIVMLMRVYIPLILIIVLNLLVFKKMLKKNFCLAQVKKEYRYTILVFQLGIIYWLFYAPTSICVILNVVKLISNNLFTQEYQIEIYNFVLNMSHLVCLLYHCWFFFLNLWLNKAFRNEFYVMIRIKKRMVRRRRKIIQRRSDNQKALRIVKRRFAF